MALIDDAIWREGPKAVAGAIEGVQLRHAARIAPPLRLREKVSLFEISEDNSVPDEIVAFARERAEMLLANAVDAGATNGFT